MRSTLKLAAFLVASLAFDLMTMNLTAIRADAAAPKMPTFYARRDYQVTPATAILVADTNRDGIPDILVNGSGSVDVMLGNGDGTFRSGPNSKAPVFSIANFALADLNGDGIPDLVVAGALYNLTGGIGVSLGNGDGTFSTGIFFQAGSGNAINGVVIGDFTGDGILDVVAVGNGGVWLFTGTGGGSFDQGVMIAPLSASPNNVVASDLNGDKKLDLVIPLQGPGFVVLFGNGNGTFQSPLAFSQPGNTNFVAVGSLTKGGPPGIVLAGTTATYVYYGNGAGKFFGPYTLPGSGGGVSIGDVNGDGIPDIVSSAVYVYFGTGGGKFSKPYYYPIEGAGTITSAYGLALADLRNNGRTDIITDGGGVSVLLSQGKGVFEDGIWTNVTGGASCGVKGDFNHDGKPDLAVNNSQGISILLGTGKYAAPFTAGTNIALAGAGCLVAGDLNGDGKLDLLVPVNGTVVAYLGNGDGTFTLKSTTPTPSGGSLALGDFNHDGKLDFATSGNVIALGNGDGTFDNPMDVVANPPPGGFSGVATGDINNDGWTDLVFTSNVFPVDATVTVLLNNKQGSFTQAPPTNFGALTVQPILADLNGDGNLDLILSQASLLFGDPSDYGASVYLGNGKGGFTFSQTVGGQTQYSTLNLVADVNGDGIPDICELHSDTLDIYLGAGSATYATPFSIGTGPYPGSVLVENLHGQSKAASLPDIVVPDTSGGVTVLLNVTK